MVFDALLPVARHGVDDVAVIFIAVGSQRGEQTLPHQVRGIDVDVEIIRNARYFTSLAQRAGISLDFLVLLHISGITKVTLTPLILQAFDAHGIKVRNSFLFRFHRWEYLKA